MTSRRTRKEEGDDKEEEEEAPAAEGRAGEAGVREERPEPVAESGGYILEEGKEDQGWRLKNPPIAPETSTTTPPEEVPPEVPEPENVIDNKLPEPEAQP